MDGLAFRFVDGSADCSVDSMGLCCAGCKWRFVNVNCNSEYKKRY
jgi:hypothetical protein